MIFIKGMKQSKPRPKVPHSAPIGRQTFIDTIFTNHNKILNLFHFSKAIFYLTFLLLLSKNGSGDITITDSTYRRKRIWNRLTLISNTTCRISVSGPLDLVDYKPTRKSNISVFFIAASISSFCSVCLFDFSAAPQARKVISNIKISQAFANRTGAIN